MSGYARHELREQLQRGPYEGEDFFRLQVTGNGGTKHLNVSPDELAKIIDAIDFDQSHIDTIRTLLCQENPNEPGGDWSLMDLTDESGIDWFDIEEALVQLRAETGGGRYVAGTSGHLYSIPADAEDEDGVPLFSDETRAAAQADPRGEHDR